jgi:hypothetical protein
VSHLQLDCSWFFLQLPLLQEASPDMHNDESTIGVILKKRK